MKRQMSLSERVHPYSEEAPLNYPSVEPHGSQHHETQTINGVVDREEKKVVRPDHHPVGGAAGFNEDMEEQRRRKRRRRCCVRCCCCVGVCLGTLLVIIGVLVLVFFLVLHPKLPKYTISDATISRFIMSNSTGSNSSATASEIIATAAGGSGSDQETVYLTVDMVLAVRMENPNKKIGIDYRSIDARLLYEGVVIGEGSIPRFYQGHKNVTHIGLAMQGRDIALTPAMGSILRETLRDEESIVLRARTIVNVRIKIGSWTTRTNKVRVKCSVELTNPARGQVRLLHNSCKFRLLRFRL